MKRCICMFAALVSFSAFMTPAEAQTNLITNGSFEANGGAGTSIFTNWSVSNIAGGSGSWYVQTGTGSPLNNFTVPVPTNGAFAAMTDQTGPGTHVIIQSFVAPAGGLASAILSFDWFVNNQSGSYIINPIGLDHTGGPNQFARVDILTGAAGAFSTAPADILLNALLTNPGDPLVSGYNSASIDVTALLNAQGGNTLQLRFAEVDNQNFFAFGADNVSLLASVPEPTTWMLIALTITLVGGIYFFRRYQAHAKIIGWDPDN